MLGHGPSSAQRLYMKKGRIWAPPEMEEATCHSWVILLLLLKFAVPLQTALPTLVQMWSYVDARAVLQKRLTWLLQLPHLTHIFQHRLANWVRKSRSKNLLVNCSSKRILASIIFSEICMFIHVKPVILSNPIPYHTSVLTHMLKDLSKWTPNWHTRSIKLQPCKHPVYCLPSMNEVYNSG